MGGSIVVLLVVYSIVGGLLVYCVSISNVKVCEGMCFCMGERECVLRVRQRDISTRMVTNV